MILHPGFASTVSHVQSLAESLHQRGWHVLTYDPRHFGQSGGHPRHHIDPEAQLEDLLLSIEKLHKMPDLRPSTIHLWGVSLGGALVLAAAARRAKIASVTTVAPLIDGRCNAKRSLRPFHTLERTNGHIRLTGSANSLFPEAAAQQYFQDLSISVTAKSILKVAHFTIQDTLNTITCPVVMILSKTDTINYTDLQLQAYATICSDKTLIWKTGSHFELAQSAPCFM